MKKSDASIAIVIFVLLTISILVFGDGGRMHGGHMFFLFLSTLAYVWWAKNHWIGSEERSGWLRTVIGGWTGVFLLSLLLKGIGVPVPNWFLRGFGLGWMTE